MTLNVPGRNRGRRFAWLRAEGSVLRVETGSSSDGSGFAVENKRAGLFNR